ncbi:MAG: NAD-dependent succinate-semialdehyde dehydrogenase [Bacteroidota bacterium]
MSSIKTLGSINPATGQTIATYPVNTTEETEAIISLAEKAFSAWSQTSFAHRATLMQKAADMLLARKAELGLLMTREMGKVLKDSIAEVEKCANCCRYYAENAEAFLADEPIKTEASDSFVAYQPLGPVLAIMPWNFPFWQVFRFAAPALMAGNVGILKHASNVQGCGYAIQDIFREAGFPEGCFSNVAIPGSEMEALIAHRAIKAVTLTGSENAGIQVAATAGKNLKKTVLELGGSDAFIVLEDVDIPAVASLAAKARMINAGQSCIAAKRFIVVNSIAESFAKEMAAAMDALVMGDPENPATNYGPQARQDLAAELEKQVNACLQGGAVARTKAVPKADGAWFPATLLDNVQPGTPGWDEELFGPVASLIRVKDAEEAITVANSSRFGLGGSIWTADSERGKLLARSMEAGCIFVNEIVKSDPRVPFGGIKKSGFGRELSHHGIKEFVNVKTVWVK